MKPALPAAHQWLALAFALSINVAMPGPDANKPGW